MSKLKDSIERKLFYLKTGTRMELENNSNPVEELVIRYKDYFFNIMLDVESGEPTGSFGWTQGTPITDTPIRDFYTAVKEVSNE